LGIAKKRKVTKEVEDPVDLENFRYLLSYPLPARGGEKEIIDAC